jgi:hypothetical protein
VTPDEAAEKVIGLIDPATRIVGIDRPSAGGVSALSRAGGAAR